MITTLLGLAALAVAWWRIEPLVARWLAVRERAVGLGPEAPGQAEAALRRRGVPAGLLQICRAESEPWAREQAMAALLEDYESAAARVGAKDADPWALVTGQWVARA